jgi:hypothetical protein
MSSADAGEQGAQGVGRLSAGERGVQAVVDAVSEGQMAGAGWVTVFW